MKKIFNLLEVKLDQLNKPLTKEQLETFVYSLFCAIIFITPVFKDVYNIGMYSLKTTIFNLTTIITSVALIIINKEKIRILKNIRDIKLNIYSILLVVYLLLVTLSTIFTKCGIMECILGTNGRGEGTITIFSYIATFIIFCKGYTKMKGVSVIAIIAAVIVGLFAIYQSYLPNDKIVPFLHSKIGDMVGATIGNPNFLSSYICIFLPMACFYFISSNTWKKNTIVIIIVLFLGLLTTVTLGGYITFAFVYLIMSIVSMILSKNRKKTLKRIIILTLIIGVAFIANDFTHSNKYSESVYESRVEVENLIEKKDDFGTGRAKIWKKTFMVIKEYPIWGVGPDSFGKVVNQSKYVTEGANDYLYSYRIDKAHCEPLQIAVTTGVFSAILYLILVFSITIEMLVLAIKKVNKNGLENKEARTTTMILICLVSYLIQGCCNISVVQVAPIFWAILGTALGTIQNSKISTL